MPNMKILVVMNAKEVRLGGGIIQVIMNLKTAFKQVDEFQFDYAINAQSDSGLESLLRDGKSKFFDLPNKSNNLIGYCCKLIKICKQGKYDAIHVHGSSSTMVLELFCAYLAGIKKRIAHSHNSQCSHPKINKIFNPFLKCLSTDKLACSKIAGEWLFGKNNFAVIHNAFDIDKYKFNMKHRQEQRKSRAISNNQLVLGMVGNLNEQKNPMFSLELFGEVSKHIDSRLIYIGDGPLREELIKRANELGIQDKVVLEGVRNDVWNELQMVDVFLFPSKFEGLGISILEAQIAGCYCLASINVPKETRYADDTKYLHIDKIDCWLECILNYKKDDTKRKMMSDITLNRIAEDYDLDREMNKLIRIYRDR